MSIPQVSVIMSAYNGEPYLVQAVESVLLQSFTNFEYIIIDDGSTDNTWAILSAYAARDPRIVLLRNEKNIGYTRSLNKGIEHAHGIFIARQDADDVSLPERLARQVAYLEENPEVGLVGTLPQFIGPDNIPIVISDYPLVTDNQSIQECLLNRNCIRHGSVMIQRKWLDVVGTYNVDLEPSEDYDLWLRLAEVTKLVNLEECLYQYREHPGSESSKRRYRQMFNKAVALERAIYRRYGSEPPADRLVNVARDYLRAAVLGYASSQFSGAQESLNHALTLNPTLLENGNLLEEILTRYLRDRSVQEALDFTEAIFTDLFPPRSHLARVKARLLSKLHMSEVFAGLNQNQTGRIDQHLWPGIHQDPTWLLNRGVLALLVKHLAGKVA